MCAQDEQQQGITSSARSVLSLAPALRRDACFEELITIIQNAALRRYLRPEEEQRLADRFSLYLTARAALLQTIAELRPVVQSVQSGPEVQIRSFLLGYTAACLLIQAGWFLVGFGQSPGVIQKALDQARPELGIPRKQFTLLYRSLTNPLTRLRMVEAIRFADRNRGDLLALRADDAMQPLVELLGEVERPARQAMRLPWLGARLRYRVHSIRRRRRSAAQRATFALLEAAGRVIAEMRNPFHQKRVTSEVLARMTALLKPGDVIITRHDDAMSNLFLPGFWPHAALYLGTVEQCRTMRVTVDPDRIARWIEPNCVLEAKKDGVRLRALAETLAVDAVTVLRPQLDVQILSSALSRALVHEGKLYDFNFDFTRSDRLVCTEVIYRAYDGLGPIALNLKERASRSTLSAGDMVRLAVEGRGFEPVCVFGVHGVNGLITGPETGEALRRTLEEAGPAL